MRTEYLVGEKLTPDVHIHSLPPNGRLASLEAARQEAQCY
jgi:hypothetical protein